MYIGLIKPFFDFLFALLGTVLLFPIFIVVVAVLFILNSGKPFFFQERPGKNERMFTIVKFRTMNNKVDSQGNLLPDAERLTAFGKFIRKTSLDEIPQLWNILTGNMSFVGPRPLLPQYLPLYNDLQRKRHDVKPGITGWAQINGRNAISWDKKFEYDIFYVQNCSFVLDVKILLKTLQKVLIRADINSQGMATTERFKGN